MIRRRRLAIALALIWATASWGDQEIQFHYDTSNTLYALVRLPSTGKVWDVTTGNWATWTDENIGDYDVPLVSQSGMYYAANFPTGITTAGVYAVAIREQSGEAPDTEDDLVGSGAVEWDGTAERHLAAVQLADDGLDQIPTTAPTGVASDFREMMVQLWRRFFKKTTLTTTELTTYGDDGSTVLTTQEVGETTTTQTMGAAE